MLLQQSTKIEVPTPPMYKGKKDAQEMENYIWVVEQYFRTAAIGVEL